MDIFLSDKRRIKDFVLVGFIESLFGVAVRILAARIKYFTLVTTCMDVTNSAHVYHFRWTLWRLP